MLNQTRIRNFTTILSIAAIGAALSFGTGGALAEDKANDQNVSEAAILRALAPEKKPLTRGLSIGAQPIIDPAAAAAEGQFVQKIRGRLTRSLSSTEREEIATMVKDKPKIDLEINFEYNSAEISSKSLPSVQALGRALSNSDLRGSTFIVAGHTDAAGGESYNLDLSERRADAIKRYLVDKYGINGSDLVTVGYAGASLKIRASLWRKSTAACRSLIWITRRRRPNNNWRPSHRERSRQRRRRFPPIARGEK